MNWKLETVEKKTSVANYLVLHRFGTVQQLLLVTSCCVCAAPMLDFSYCVIWINGNR